MSVCLCVRVFLLAWLLVSLSFCQSVFLSVCLSVSLSFYLSVFLPVCLSASVFLPVCLFVSLFLYQFVFFVSLSFCQAVFLSVFLYDTCVRSRSIDSPALAVKLIFQNRDLLPTYFHRFSQFNLNFRGIANQRRIHGKPSRMRVGRGCICGDLIIWAGGVRPKTAKTPPKKSVTDWSTKRGVVASHTTKKFVSFSLFFRNLKMSHTILFPTSLSSKHI